MKLECALCGRPMDAAAFLIGNMPIGPTCGKKAGFTKLAKRKGGLVLTLPKSRKKQRGDTLDLFEDVQDDE